LSSDKVERLGELVEPWFCFSLVWTVGATCDNHSRAKFDRWMRAAMTDAHVSTHTLTYSPDLPSLCSALALAR